MIPSLAICGHATPDLAETIELALEAPGPVCIEYSFDPRDVEAARPAVDFIRAASPVGSEVRFHFPLGPLELGDIDPEAGERALSAMTDAVRLISQVGGEYLTVHAALPEGAHEFRVFAETTDRLRRLVGAGAEVGVTVALENLRWGLTSDPRHFLDLVRNSGAAVTLDVGHAVSSELALRGVVPGTEFARMLAPRIVGAHVYDREDPHHFAPTDLDRIGETLEVLLSETECRWWVIELFNPEEVRSTRALLSAFLAEKVAS